MEVLKEGKIDVFFTPHLRMRQLIRNACYEIEHKCNLEKTLNSLKNIERTFNEFLFHERIENTIILERLKEKIEKQNEVEMKLVCECHSHDYITPIFNILEPAIRIGIDLNGDIVLSHNNTFEFRLMCAELQKKMLKFKNFFLPHMKLEEDIFQPMLCGYFSTGELLTMRNSVIKLHRDEIYGYADQVLIETSILSVLNETSTKIEEIDNETESSLMSMELKGINLKEIREELNRTRRSFIGLPLSIQIEVMKYLSLGDMCRLSRTNHTFYNLLKHPNIWKIISYRQLIDWNEGDEKREKKKKRREEIRKKKKEIRCTNWLLTQMLPTRINNKILGGFVQVLDVSGSICITTQDLIKFIHLCKNIVELNISGWDDTDDSKFACNSIKKSSFDLAAFVLRNKYLKRLKRLKANNMKEFIGDAFIYALLERGEIVECQTEDTNRNMNNWLKYFRDVYYRLPLDYDNNLCTMMADSIEDSFRVNRCVFSSIDQIKRFIQMKQQLSGSIDQSCFLCRERNTINYDQHQYVFSLSAISSCLNALPIDEETELNDTSSSANINDWPISHLELIEIKSTSSFLPSFHQFKKDIDSLCDYQNIERLNIIW
ncbi:hypothetical protein SNEBB_009015 [Seison nebaliae]|nr:hypothetical protein SNEBB_009015 [Seison nebaliae]